MISHCSYNKTSTLPRHSVVWLSVHPPASPFYHALCLRPPGLLFGFPDMAGAPPPHCLALLFLHLGHTSHPLPTVLSLELTFPSGFGLSPLLVLSSFSSVMAFCVCCLVYCCCCFLLDGFITVRCPSSFIYFLLCVVGLPQFECPSDREGGFACFLCFFFLYVVCVQQTFMD